MYEINCEKVMELDHVYMVFRGLPEWDMFEEEMIGNNVIPGILPMQTVCVGTRKVRRYRVDGCVSLPEYLLGQKLSGTEFRRILSALFAGIAESRKYLLREESFVLQPACIFLRTDTGTVELIYCPEYEKPLAGQMRELSDWLLGYLDPQDAQAVYSGYAFHVMSHEEGNTVQRMLTAVAGEPGGDSGQMPVRTYQLPGEVPEYVMAPEPEEPAYTSSGNSKKRGLRGLFSFLSGISVIFLLLSALAWAMG